ncbi:Membrane-bound transcription factor site-2 protease [Actinomortierella ambigua]|nr:Membrane-bound transcription factor site-2 protease [Actinomortierella ambigua]
MFLLKRFLNRPNLPVPGGSDTYELLPTSASTSKVATSPSHRLLVKPFHIRFTTISLNRFFYKWGSHPRLARFWRVSYDLGVLFALFAMVAGWALLIYAAMGLVATTASQLLDLWAWVTSVADSSHLGTTGSGDVSASGMLRSIQKRALEDSVGPPGISHGSAAQTMGQARHGAEEHNMVLVPVVPGVTHPISHLPYYLLALLISGIVHEAGHAFAAARERTQLSSSGIFLYILYPGAFVDIPSRAMSILTPIQQLRIICAGVWHNIVLFVIVWLIISSQTLQFSFRILGWLPLDDAVTVAGVSKASPLYGHLAAGSIITQVDDVSLQGNPLGTWNQMLLNPESINSHENDRGFCVPEKLLNVSLQDDIDPDPNRIIVYQGQCLPSFDILADGDTKRCSLSASSGDGGLSTDCPSTHRCYRPFHANTTAAMIRLHCRPAPWITDKNVGCNHLSDPDASSTSTTLADGNEDEDEDEDEEVPQVEGEDHDPSTARHRPTRIVLYQGDPRDIWDGVQVTNMTTRWSFLPLGLYSAAFLTLNYLMSFSLALSILNIVPARHLDGHHALKSLWHLTRMMKQSFKHSGSIAQTIQECILVDVAGISAAAATTVAASSTVGEGDDHSTISSGAPLGSSGAQHSGATLLTSSSSAAINSAALAASLSLSTAVSNSSKRAPWMIKGIVVMSTVLLGCVMVGSLLQMVIQLYF